VLRVLLQKPQYLKLNFFSSWEFGRH
jgi:hypothetical protein